MLRNGLPRMMDTFESGLMSSTMKSTGTRKSLILTGMFPAMPNGCVDTVFGHVSMIGKSIDRQNKAVVFGLQGELPMEMVADGRVSKRD